MYKVSMTRYPNSETRLVYSRLPGARKERYTDVGKTVHAISEEGRFPQGSEDPSSPFFLTLGANSKPVENCFGKPCKPGWGDIPRWTRFGLNAKRTILRVGGVLDDLCQHPSEVVFLTGTMPNGYDDGRIMASAYSGWFVHSLKAWVNKTQDSKHDFYVWEFTKRGVLHLHYAVWMEDASKRERILSGFRDQWINLLCRLTDSCGVDMCWSSPDGSSRQRTVYIQAYAQEVYSSAARYLAKYTSKSLDSGEVVGGRVLYPPSRWWGVSRPLLSALRERTHREEMVDVVPGKMSALYEDASGILTSCSDKAYRYETSVGGGKVTVAYNTAQEAEKWIDRIWKERNLMPNSLNSSTTSDVVITTLRAIVRAAQVSPSELHNGYTPFSAQCLQRLLDSDSVSIIESTEVITGLQYLLWSRYRFRNTVPVWYERAQARLESNLNWVLTRKSAIAHSLEDPLKTLD